MTVVPVETLRDAYLRLARQLGASEEEGAIFASCFLTPDLRRHYTQGVAYAPTVCRWLLKGQVAFGAPPTVLTEGPGFVVADAGRGLGQIQATRAMEIAIKKAKTSGVAGVWVRNSHDFTMAANYAMQALAHDFVGIAMSQSGPFVVPWGGRDPVFGTNPFAAAIPAGTEYPIVIDMASGAVSHGQAIYAARDRRTFSMPVLVDTDGQYIADPAPVIVDPSDRNSQQLGGILPLGHKGYGWLILVDILAGIMSGMRASHEVIHHSVEHGPDAIGHCFIAIDVSQLLPLDEFKSKVDGLIRAVKASRPAQGFDEVVLPGEKAARHEEECRRTGVPLRDEDWAKLVRVAREVGVDLSGVAVSA